MPARRGARARPPEHRRAPPTKGDAPSRSRRWAGPFGLVVALLLAAHVAPGALGVLFEEARATQAPPRMMPAVGGPIEELAIQLHGPHAARFLAVYAQLFAHLDPRTTVRVVVADDADVRRFESARERWPAAARRPRVRFVRTGRPITSWARDRLAVLEAEDRSILVAPPEPMHGPEERVHDWLVPWALRRELGAAAEVRAASFRFDGGDLIADERRVFIATPLLERNPGMDPRALEEAVAKLTGLEVVRLGDERTPVPDHHIGMFVTPLGGGRVAYGEPDLALAALRARGELPPGPAPDTVVLEVGGEALELDLRPASLEPFRNVGRILREQGLEAVPLPILPSTERHVFVGYDNVLLERRGDALHVLLPTYGVPALDQAAEDAWRAAGARVHRIDVRGVFRLGGTVRCLVAPLRRGRGRAD